MRPRIGTNSVSWLNLKLSFTFLSTVNAKKLDQKSINRGKDNDHTVNSESGNAQDRTVDRDEFRDERASALPDDDSSGQGKVSVEPGVPDSTAVGLHADLEIG